MKRIIFSALIFTALSAFAQQQKEIGNLVYEGIPDIPADMKERMNQYQNTRSAGFADWNPAGTEMLMTTRFGETPQLHMINHPGGARRQITFFKEPVASGSFCPDSTYKGFMFLKDAGGNEFTQLYWFDTQNGKYEMVSDGGRSQNDMPLWSNAGNRFIYTSTRRNQKDYDLYASSMTNPKEAKLILQMGGSWSAMDWSPDDKKLLVHNFISATKAYLCILDLESQKLDTISPSPDEIFYGNAVWSADGKGIFMVNDQDNEFQALKYYDVASRKVTVITSSIPWDVDGFTINKKRTRMVFSINENGFSKLFLLDAVTKKYTPIDNLPSGVIGGYQFRPGDADLALTINTPQSPGDIYTYTFADKKLTRWTYSEVGGMNTAIFPEAKLIEYETFDNAGAGKRKIPAIIFKPKLAKGKLPVIIIIHGGPESVGSPGTELEFAL